MFSLHNFQYFNLDLRKLFLFILFFSLQIISGFAQQKDTLVVTFNKHFFQQGDSIDFNINWLQSGKPLKAATIKLLIEQVATGKRWSYRYPILNGQLEGGFQIDTAIANGRYAFNFVLQKDFFKLYGKVMNAQEKDTSVNCLLLTKSMQILNKSVHLDVDKTFCVNGLLFQDTAFMMFSNPRKKYNTPEIKFYTPLDSVYVPYLTSTQFIEVGMLADTNKKLTDTVGYSFSLNDPVYKEILPTVVVNAKKKSLVEKYEDEYVSGLFKGQDAIVFDGMESDQLSRAPNLFTFLSGMVGGLKVARDEFGEEHFKWRGHQTEIYLNEIKIDQEEISGLSTSDIAMVKVYRPGSQVSFGSGDGGIIAIYTKIGPYRTSNKVGNSIHVRGYNAEELIWK